MNCRFIPFSAGKGQLHSFAQCSVSEDTTVATFCFELKAIYCELRNFNFAQKLFSLFFTLTLVDARNQLDLIAPLTALGY
jgi:hypothetical protein